MMKRTSSLPGAGRRRRWGVALVAATLAGSVSSTSAQSVLRFVEAGSDTSPVASQLPAPIVAAAPVAESSFEFRILEVKEGKTPPLPQITITGPAESAHGDSTLTFARPEPSVTPETKASVNCELRFVTARPARPIESIAPRAEVATEPSEPENELATVEPDGIGPATELFATPPLTRPSAFKPRIMSVLEHVPAPVPQLVDAEPVRSAGNELPTFAPAGSRVVCLGHAGAAQVGPAGFGLRCCVA